MNKADKEELARQYLTWMSRVFSEIQQIIFAAEDTEKQAYRWQEENMGFTFDELYWDRAKELRSAAKRLEAMVFEREKQLKDMGVDLRVQVEDDDQ